jgi:hypothetical protein
MESVAGLPWNGWLDCRGMGGWIAVESVAGFAWNWWPHCRGIRNCCTTFAGRQILAGPSTDVLTHFIVVLRFYAGYVFRAFEFIEHVHGQSGIDLRLCHW